MRKHLEKYIGTVVTKTCAFRTTVYAFWTWIIKKTDTDKIVAFEMYCYRRILHLSWTMKVRNREIRKRQNIKVDLMQSNEKETGSIFGHTCIFRMKDSRKNKKV